MARLHSQCSLVECIPEDSEGEDGEGEGIAAVICIAAGELGESLVVVFSAGSDVPESWVEDDACC